MASFTFVFDKPVPAAIKSQAIGGASKETVFLKTIGGIRFLSMLNGDFSHI
jgi:hypothetical protein